jgi:hypothetical protein
MEPHLEQYKINFGENSPKEEITLVKRDEDPKNINPGKEYVFSTVSWPERKYFIMILSFLTAFSKGGEHILLLGAEPGRFLLHLMPLFPTLTWEIWNSNDYDKRLAPKRKEIWRNPFPLDANRKYQLPTLPNVAKDDRIFIISFLSNLDFNRKLLSNIDPNESLVLFNPPDVQFFDYLDGTLLLQPWNDQTSGETMLIPTGGRKKWEGKRYHAQMLEFDLMKRASYYEHNVQADGLDHCFDCSGEVAVWKLFLLSRKQIPEDTLVAEYINELTKFLLTA